MWAKVGRAYHSALESLYVSEGEEMLIPSVDDDVEDAKLHGCLVGLNDSGKLYVPGQYNTEERLFFEVDGVRWQGIIDRYDTEHGIVTDWKSSGAPAGMTLLKVAFQMSVYIQACVAHEREVSQVLINAIRKPGLRIGKSEDIEKFRSRVLADVKKRPDYYFMPYQFRPSEWDWEQRFDDLNRIAKDILARVPEGEVAFPRNTGECLMMSCDYELWCRETL
jgi:hypothetical protein